MDTMETKFKITKVKREPYFNMKQPHFHEENEIYYLISGERNFTINDRVAKISRGHIVIIPAGEMHRTTYFEGGAHERYAILFSEDYMQEIYDRYGKEEIKQIMGEYFFRVPEGRRSYVEELLGRMLYEYDGIDELSEAMIKVYFHELILFLLRCHKNDFKPEEIHVVDEMIQKAAKYIFENSNENLGLNDVAKMFGMSSSYFSKKFKAVTGFGFKEYLIGVRIKEATTLLLTTNLSVTEIAIQCGFNDSNYFGDAFRRVKGVSPNKYRKNKGSI